MTRTTKIKSLTYLKPMAELGSAKPHGTRLKYMSGCKCLDCKAANSQYERERKKARKEGKWNGIISAKKARSHIKRLSKKGIGYKTIADVAGLAASTLFKIKSGERLYLRAENERRILSVDETCLADSAVISAKESWKKLEWIFAQGLTEQEIAKRLGYKTERLQIKENILASTALKIERLYNRIKSESEIQETTHTDDDLATCIAHAKKHNIQKSDAEECFDFSVGCPNCPFINDFK